LTKEQPYQEDWKLMLDGYHDGYHAGFDCTRSRVRFNQWGHFPSAAAPLHARGHL
jgi:hypothetical protein